MNDRYADMLHLPHPDPDPKKHPRMALEKRAAQFAPFAALTGFEDIIEEHARETDKKAILSETAKEQLDQVLSEALSRIEEHPMIRLTYFRPDGRKVGGCYETVEGPLKKIDTIRKVLTLEGNRHYWIEDIHQLEIVYH